MYVCKCECLYVGVKTLHTADLIPFKSPLASQKYLLEPLKRICWCHQLIPDFGKFGVVVPSYRDEITEYLRVITNVNGVRI